MTQEEQKFGDRHRVYCTTTHVTAPATYDVTRREVKNENRKSIHRSFEKDGVYFMVFRSFNSFMRFSHFRSQTRGRSTPNFACLVAFSSINGNTKFLPKEIVQERTWAEKKPVQPSMKLKKEACTCKNAKRGVKCRWAYSNDHREEAKQQAMPPTSIDDSNTTEACYWFRQTPMLRDLEVRRGSRFRDSCPYHRCYSASRLRALLEPQFGLF